MAVHDHLAPVESRALADGAAFIAGLDSLWRLTRGDPRVVIAILDGPVDLSHPAFVGANVDLLDEGSCANASLHGAATRHGTLVAGLILGRPVGSNPVLGVAPGCRGLIIPIFHDRPNPDGSAGELPRAGQLELAQAISLAVERGAWIINVSAGEPSPTGTAHPLLAAAVARAVRVFDRGGGGQRRLRVPASSGGAFERFGRGRDGRPGPAS